MFLRSQGRICSPIQANNSRFDYSKKELFLILHCSGVNLCISKVLTPLVNGKQGKESAGWWKFQGINIIFHIIGTTWEIVFFPIVGLSLTFIILGVDTFTSFAFLRSNPCSG